MTIKYFINYSNILSLTSMKEKTFFTSKFGILLAVFLIVSIFTASLIYYNDSIADKNSYAEADSKVDLAGIEMMMISSQFCGCCDFYLDYLLEFQVEVNYTKTEYWMQYKYETMLPQDMWSCHTSYIGGYFIEGHIPISVIAKLLESNPDIDGIALSGIPQGAPGMDGKQVNDFTFYMFKDGQEVGVFTVIEKP
jgi:hypothetical protein